MNEYELIGRLADLDTRLKKLEGIEPIQQPQPAPVPPLVEAVEDIGKACEETNEPISKRLAGTIGLALLALAAEKRRNQLIANLILVAKSHRNKADNLDRAITALDAFDKERGA